MKIKDIISEATPEWIKHPHAKGVMIKNPKWVAPEKPAKEPSGLNRSDAMKKRHADAKAKYYKIFSMIEHAVSNAFPDGEPMDHIPIQQIKRMCGVSEWGEVMPHINRAVRLGTDGRYVDLDSWLASMWDDAQRDAIHDAKMGNLETYSPFYRVQDDGKGIFPMPNPWKA